VTARINHQEMRLDHAAMKTLFLDVIKRAKEKYSFQIENFTVMGNHFHLIIRPTNKSSLSRIMQWVMGVFAMTYNRIHCLKGHLWQGRFFSRVIGTLRELLQVFDYIDENPVKAGQVSYPRDWHYGGLAHRRSYQTAILVPLEPFLTMLLPAHQGLLIRQ